MHLAVTYLDKERLDIQAAMPIQYVTAEWEPVFLRQAREFLFFPFIPREASKRVPIFDRGTGSKPERLRSGFKTSPAG